MASRTDLIAGRDHNVCTSQEVGDGARMGVEETLFRLGHTVTTPVYLHELREFALWAYGNE
jgi:hypothetical protein